MTLANDKTLHFDMTPFSLLLFSQLKDMCYLANKEEQDCIFPGGAEAPECISPPETEQTFGLIGRSGTKLC